MKQDLKCSTLSSPACPVIYPKGSEDNFGDKFAFRGAIDQQDLLPSGTDEELGINIIEKISIPGKGGG